VPPNEEAARFGGTDQSGSDSENTSTSIIPQCDEACTAIALLAHDLLHFAAATDDANLARLAPHVFRLAVEIHAIGQVLPAAVMLATLNHEVAA
jgi:hypothetical protein